MNIFENCMYFSTNLLARRLDTIAEEAFSDMDITATQGFTLIAIGELEKHTPSEIANEIKMKPSTITRFIDRLEKLGYVERNYKGRSVIVNMTDLGEEKLKETKKCWEVIHEKNVEIFKDNDAEKITNDMIKANRDFSEYIEKKHK